MRRQDFNEKQVKIYHHFLELQNKYKLINEDKSLKENGLHFNDFSISIIPVIQLYFKNGTISNAEYFSIKNDFPFYIKRDKVQSIEKDIEAFRGSDVFIVKYLFDGDTYDLIFSCPAKAILV